MGGRERAGGAGRASTGTLRLGRLSRKGAVRRRVPGSTCAVGCSRRSRSRPSASGRRRSSSRSPASGREQFGKKIGTYQAISHSLVDAYVAVELSRSLRNRAAWSVAEDDEQVDLAVAAAKSQAAEAAVLACEHSIRAPHGGIGFTWEHPLHRYCAAAEGALGYGGELRARRPHPYSPRKPAPRPASAARRSSACCAPVGPAHDWSATPAMPCCWPGERARVRPERPGGGRSGGRWIEHLDGLVENAGIAIAGPLDPCRRRRASSSTFVRSCASCRRSCPPYARPGGCS